MFRFAVGDEWHQENAGEECRGGPEQRQLQVPGAGQLVGQHPGQIQVEKRRQIRAVVFGRRAQQRLGQEQHRHDLEETDAGPLRWCQADLAGPAKRQVRRLGAVPADLLTPSPVDGEHDPDAAQQRDKRQRRPHDHSGGRSVVYARLGRPVIGVAVLVPRGVRRQPHTPSARKTLSDHGFTPYP